MDRGNVGRKTWKEVVDLLIRKQTRCGTKGEEEEGGEKGTRKAAQNDMMEKGVRTSRTMYEILDDERRALSR